MPSKTEKQKKFFGAVMGAKKGQGNVSGKAKKVAKDMPKKEIKKFLKKEGEEDEQSISKQMKKSGKATFKGPDVKERKKFAPPTKVQKSKKDYDRKKKSVAEEDEEKACWKGYKKQGTKKKGGKTVNNCVKESTDISEFIEAVLLKNYAKADKHLKDVVEMKLAEKIKSELNTPLF